LLKQQQSIINDFDDLQYTFEQSHIIVNITRKSYNNYIKQIIKDIHYLQKLSRSRKISQSIHMYWNIVWSRVVTNKIHFEITLIFKTIQLFKNISVTQKWFLIRISFEQSFTQMTNWIEIFETRNWTELQKYSLWSEKETHYAKLKLYTVFSLHQIKKMHNCIVVEKETDWDIINQHIKLLINILRTLWLKQSAI